jgi:NAD-reducing hydrogenase small subunit
MRNPIGVQPLLDRSYIENATINAQVPSRIVPKLLPTARPVHRVVPVDIFLPGCPPSADLIYCLLDDLLAGRVPDVAGARFGR